MHSQLLSIFGETTTLNEKEQDLFCQLFQPQSLRKGDFFLKAGTYNTAIAFLTKGLVRYYVDHEAGESTTEFSKEGEFITDYQSFINKEKAEQNIQAIQDCELLVISHFDLQLLTSASETGEIIGRFVLESRFNTMVNHLLSTYMHTSMERYQNFLEDYGDPCPRVPRHMIASYVGVKLPSLSRIRKRMEQNIS